MSPGEITVIVIAVAFVAGIIISQIVRKYKARKSGEVGGCCGCCSSCTHCSGCAPDNGAKNDQI